jgi:basic amino acid/polyamine antiporter, APA family
MSQSTAVFSVRPKQQLTLFDAICIITGIVIGAGIYETTPLIAKSVTTPVWLIAIWLLGGLLSMIGALCYAELVTHYPEEGGDYVFLNKAYSRRMGFLFVWAGFWLVRPANIGAIAFIFAHYAQQIVPLQMAGFEFITYAIAAVILLTLINIIGVQSGKWAQNLLTSVKVLGLLVIITVGLFFTVPVETSSTENLLYSESSFYLAMILVLFTYGGWGNISFVAAEVIHPQKNILRSLIIGTVLIISIYVVINLAFLRTLGMDGMSASTSIASDLVRISFGEAGALLISFLICITCLGNINGMIFTGSRIYYAMGRDHHLYRLLGIWNARLDAPVWSLTLQAIITIILIISLGTNGNAFERLVVFSAPLHWFFFLLVAISLFILRRKRGPAHVGFKVPWYPWLPIIFCLSTLFMLYASINYAWQQQHPEIWWIIIIMVLGVLASVYNPPAKET